MEALETIEKDGWKVEIYPDDGPCNPRVDMDCATRLFTWGREIAGLTLPAKGITHQRSEPDDILALYDELLHDHSYSHSRYVIVRPLYFDDYGSSGCKLWVGDDPTEERNMCGFVTMTLYTLLTEFATDAERVAARLLDGDVPESLLEKGRRCIDAEIEMLAQWANGDVYGYVVKNRRGDEKDSCWGLYGYEYAREEAQRALDGCYKARRRRKVKA